MQIGVQTVRAGFLLVFITSRPSPFAVSLSLSLSLPLSLSPSRSFHDIIFDIEVKKKALPVK